MSVSQLKSAFPVFITKVLFAIFLLLRRALSNEYSMLNNQPLVLIGVQVEIFAFFSFFLFLTSSMSTRIFQVFYWLMHSADAALWWGKQLLRWKWWTLLWFVFTYQRSGLQNPWMYTEYILNAFYGLTRQTKKKKKKAETYFRRKKERCFQLRVSRFRPSFDLLRI